MIWSLLVAALPPAYLAGTVLAEIRLAAELVRNGVECPGTVISQRTVSLRRGHHFDVPKVRFTTLAGVIVEGESVGLERNFGNRGPFFADRAEFMNDAEAYLRYSPENPARFLFVRQLDQTRNWWILWFAAPLAIAILLLGLLGRG